MESDAEAQMEAKVCQDELACETVAYQWVMITIEWLRLATYHF